MESYLFSLSSVVLPIWQRDILWGSLQARVPKALGSTGWVTTPRWRLWQSHGTKQLFSFPYGKVFYQSFKKTPSPLKIFKKEGKTKNCVWAYHGHERGVKLKMQSVELNGLVTWNQTTCHPKVCHCNGTGESLLSGFSAHKIEARAGSQ